MASVVRFCSAICTPLRKRNWASLRSGAVAASGSRIAAAPRFASVAGSAAHAAFDVASSTADHSGAAAKTPRQARAEPRMRDRATKVEGSQTGFMR